MKISLNWLKEYVDLPKDLSPEDLALKLTMATVEVEEVIYQKDQYEKMIVGEVVEVVDHPNADKLKVCKVKADKEYQVVCGGLNVKKGMRGVLGLVGAQVRWHGQGSLITLEKTKIRGVESEGMLCAAEEIGLAELFPSKEGEIIELESDKAGQPIAEALGLDDIILDIDNKSITHRADLWGHYGMAREVAAIFNLKLKELKLEKFKEGNKADLKIKIEDKENCSRYLGLVMNNIKIEPSPLWMQSLLKAVGVRPINNIVDITNFVMLELGRPSHAFDRRQISGDTIIVRAAKKGEKFTTLDGQQHKLTSEMALVCDAKKPVDLAGIMGGANSEIKDDTTEIILELANFNPVNIRKTAAALNLRTEAAVRFEKGLDPSLAELGLKRIITLIQQFIPETTVISPAVDVNYDKPTEREIELSLEFLNQKIGQTLEKKEVIRILESLHFSVKEKNEKLTVKPPSFRTLKDISLPEDLVEEVARIYGYDNIIPQMPAVELQSVQDNPEQKLERKIREVLSLNSQATEVYNYSFVGEQNLNLSGSAEEKHQQLFNYFSEDQKYLRVSLFENLLINLRDNLRFFEEVNIFEIGRVFGQEDGQYKVSPKEKQWLTAQPKIVAGLLYNGSADVLRKVKGNIEILLDQLGVEYHYEDSPDEAPFWADPDKCSVILSGDEVLGWLGELNPKISGNLEIKSRTGLWQLDLAGLLRHISDNKKYQPIFKYPGMVYDFSIVVNSTVKWSEIQRAVLDLSPLIVKVELFDVYPLKGETSGQSLAFHVNFLDENKTLTSKEADSLKEKITNSLKEKFQADIR